MILKGLLQISKSIVFDTRIMSLVSKTKKYFINERIMKNVKIQ